MKLELDDQARENVARAPLQQDSDGAVHGGAHDPAVSAEHAARENEKLAAALVRRTPLWKPVLFVAVLVIAAGTLVAIGAVPRAERQREIDATNATLRALARRVTIAAGKLAPPTRTLTLPASLKPNASAELFAQATGFVRERKVDIGDRVAAGDVLAVLDVPLIDEQLNSARAALTEAEAARDVLARTVTLAQSTLERWRSVEPPGAVSKQELDERQNAFESARANLAAGEAAIASRRADVVRHERGQAFARIVAPFAGTVTARELEVGDYVSGTGGGKRLFMLADTRTLRAFVDVPQSFAPGVVVGGAARVTLREQPGRVVSGTIARTSGALDERTRTLRVEISVPNEKGALLAGSYAQVELELARDVRAVIVPGSALLVRAEGPRVAIVDAENKLRYRPVVVGRDLGSEVEITSGLAGDERIVVNLADELPDGSVVEPVLLPPPAAPASAPAPAKEAPRGAGSASAPPANAAK
jgi:RND family efflux transporter MFP subunit